MNEAKKIKYHVLKEKMAANSGSWWDEPFQRWTLAHEAISRGDAPKNIIEESKEKWFSKPLEKTLESPIQVAWKAHRLGTVFELWNKGWKQKEKTLLSLLLACEKSGFLWTANDFTSVALQDKPFSCEQADACSGIDVLQKLSPGAYAEWAKLMKESDHIFTEEEILFIEKKNKHLAIEMFLGQNNLTQKRRVELREKWIELAKERLSTMVLESLALDGEYDPKELVSQFLKKEKCNADKMRQVLRWMERKRIVFNQAEANDICAHLTQSQYMVAARLFALFVGVDPSVRRECGTPIGLPSNKNNAKNDFPVGVAMQRLAQREMAVDWILRCKPHLEREGEEWLADHAIHHLSVSQENKNKLYAWKGDGAFWLDMCAKISDEDAARWKECLEADKLKERFGFTSETKKIRKIL